MADRAKALDYRDAWLVAHLLQPYSKTPIRIKDILDPPAQDLDAVLGTHDSAADLEASLAEQARRRGG